MKKSSASEPPQFTVFPTALGFCALAWTEHGLSGVVYPEKSKSKTFALIRRKTPNALPLKGKAPREIRKLIKKLQEHLSGAVRDFSDVKVDLSQTAPFLRRVYEEAQRIPVGQTVSYKELAKRAGSPKAARAVGQAMARNPNLIVVPCHRVLSSRGDLTGFSAGQGVESKRRLLQMEGSQWGRVSSRASAKNPWPFEPREAVRYLRRADPELARIIDRVGPFTLQPSALLSPFEALFRSIIYQQLAGSAAATILNRVQALYGGHYPTPRALLRTKALLLRKAGLSANKSAALYDLAKKAEAGVIPDLKTLKKLPDEAIIERLTSVRGIGRWTVEMMLIFRLARPDVLAIDDFALKKSAGLSVGSAKPLRPRDFQALGEKWRPYRSVACWYLWRALDL